MAFVHNQSCQCAKSELDVFSVPPTQTSIEDVEYHSLSIITDLGPPVFDVSSSSMPFLGHNEKMCFKKQLIMIYKNIYSKSIITCEILSNPGHADANIKLWLNILLMS